MVGEAQKKCNGKTPGEGSNGKENLVMGEEQKSTKKKHEKIHKKVEKKISQ
jgi:hypothetical protein